MSLISS